MNTSLFIFKLLGFRSHICMLCKVGDYLENLIIIRSLLHLHGVRTKELWYALFTPVIKWEDHLCYTVGYASLETKIFLHQCFAPHIVSNILLNFTFSVFIRHQMLLPLQYYLMKDMLQIMKIKSLFYISYIFHMMTVSHFVFKF